MKLGFVGGGHLARALIGCLVNNGTIEIIVAERNAERRNALRRDFNVHTTDALTTANVDVVVLAVRPAQAADACADLKVTPLLISVAAGIRLAELQRWSGKTDRRLIRAMPNTPAQIGEGMTVCCAAAGVTATDKQAANNIFAAVGEVAWVGEETLMDAATAVSGSGPAYVYFLMEAMQQAATELGLPAELAARAVRQTVRGAAGLVTENGTDAAALRQSVTVPGGTTAAATATLENRHVKAFFVEAIKDAATRAQEIGDSWKEK